MNELIQFLEQIVKQFNSKTIMLTIALIVGSIIYIQLLRKRR